MTPEQQEERRKKLDALLATIVSAGGMTPQLMEDLGYVEEAQRLREMAAQDQDMNVVGTVANPLSLFGPIYDAGSGLVEATRSYLFDEPKGKPKLISREEFAASRRPAVKSVSEAQAAAEERVMNSRAYQDALARGQRTTARKMVEDARKAAAQALSGDAEQAAAAQSQIDADYEKYLQEYNRDLEAYYGQSFADRNPGLARAMPALGALGAALVTRHAFKGANDRISSAAKKIDEAIGANDPVGLAAARAAATKAQKDAKIDKALGVGTGAVVPLEIQTFADLIDAKGLDRTYQDAHGNWQRSRAQEDAEKRLNIAEDPMGFLGRNAIAVGSGIIGSMTGAHFGGRADIPRAKLSRRDLNDAIEELALLNYAKSRASGVLPPAPSGAAGRQSRPVDRLEPQPSRHQTSQLDSSQTNQHSVSQTQQQNLTSGQPSRYSRSHSKAARSYLQRELSDDTKSVTPKTISEGLPNYPAFAKRRSIPEEELRARAAATMGEITKRLPTTGPYTKAQIRNAVRAATGGAGTLAIAGTTLSDEELERILADALGGGR